MGNKVASIDAEPALLFSARRWYNAFETLSEKRIQSQTGPQAIQITEMIAYADLMDFSIVDKDDLFYYATAMDRVYLNSKHKKIAAARSKNTKQKGQVVVSSK